MRSGEFVTIARLKRRFETSRTPGVIVGIGDDAAVLDAPAGGQLVWTVDQQVEGTHFRRRDVGWADIGWRSFMAAASDLAAMGATPWSALTALSLSSTLSDEDVDELAAGLHAAAERIGAPVVGGNITRGDAVTVTTTLLGKCARAVERSGARVGDGLWVAGELGLAAAGLASLERAIVDPRAERGVRAWARPDARIVDGLRMSTMAHAAIDVSDGFAQDVRHLSDASGVRAVLDVEALARHATATGLVEIAALLEQDALELLLNGGEDYALVVASPAPIEGFWCAGAFVAGSGVALGDREIDPRGYDHFVTA